MKLIPGGSAIIGTSASEAAHLAQSYGVHPSWFQAERSEIIDVGPFLIDEYPVTNALYLRYCRDVNQPWSLAQQVENNFESLGQLPATEVNIDDARKFAEWAGKRLPTAVEWEFAARGPEGRVYPWGGEWDPSMCNCLDGTTPREHGPASVTAYPMPSPFGVRDMVGNVCEWVDTLYDGNVSHVVKGGFWKQRKPYRFRAAAVFMSQQGTNRANYIGFRCAKDVTDERASRIGT